MNRRYIIIAGVVLITIIALGALWFFFFRGEGPGNGTGDPFGNTGAGNFGTEAPNVLDDGIDFSGQAGDEVGPRLVRITDAPVAYGVAALYIPEIPATTTADGTLIAPVPPDIEVRFVERQSGNVYAYRAFGRTLTRLSNQTIPGVRESVWLSDGSVAFLRFLTDTAGLERIETYALPANDEGGYYLERGLARVAATSSSSILSLRTSTTGSIVTVANANGSSPRTAFSSALSEFVVSFFGRSYLVHTKPSVNLDGYAFLVNEGGTQWTRLAGPLRGLSALGSPTGTTIAYSYINRGAVTTEFVDVASRTAVSLPIATLMEKCTFNRDGNTLYCAVPTTLAGTLPDDWYQGGVFFSDRIWKVDLTARVAVLVVDPVEVGEVEIDAVSLTVDPTEDILTFTNRLDGSLWAYDL